MFLQAPKHDVQHRCALCKDSRTYYINPVSWEDSLWEQLLEFESIPRDSKVCRACNTDIHRNINSLEWIPRWHKKTTHLCHIDGCESSEKTIMTRFATPQTVAELMGIKQPVTESDGTPLCPTHYRQLHRTLHSHDHMYKKRKCVVCNCTVQKRDVRHCPDPKTIQEYYNSSTEFSISMQEDSVVCSTCYHAQLVIVKRHRLTSCDSDLQILLDSLSCDEPAGGEDTECIKLLAASKTASMVGNGLMEQRPMLLVDVYEFFNKTATELRRVYLPDDSSDIGTPRWLLSYLIRTLNPHLACSCKQRSTGTLLYRSGGDLLLSISKLLKMNRNMKLSSSNDNLTPTCDDSQLVSVCNAKS